MVTTIHKPVLIVIAGPNGSGKTTITTQILQHEWMENAVYMLEPSVIRAAACAGNQHHCSK